MPGGRGASLQVWTSLCRLQQKCHHPPEDEEDGNEDEDEDEDEDEEDEDVECPAVCISVIF